MVHAYSFTIVGTDRNRTLVSALANMAGFYKDTDAYITDIDGWVGMRRAGIYQQS